MPTEYIRLKYFLTFLPDPGFHQSHQLVVFSCLVVEANVLPMATTGVGPWHFPFAAKKNKKNLITH
jgi:hypothetical protein